MHQLCETCDNKGRPNGLSQESFCKSCIWQETWRVSHYKRKQTKRNVAEMPSKPAEKTYEW